jgi:hypothetical protein
MVFTIVMTPANVVRDGFNNKMVYNFPNSVSFPNHEIAIQSIYMYYSWTNINGTSLNNNKFTYGFPNTAGDWTEYDVVIPDGLYEIATLNKFLQWTMIKNGNYLINSSGNNVYYLEFVVNPALYAVQLNFYPVPTSLPSGWTAPAFNVITGSAQWTGFPPATITPVFQLPVGSGNFYKIIGFPQPVVGGVILYPDNTGAATTINASVISTTAPEVQPNPVVYLAITNIENNYATPSSIIGVISPNVGFGELIQEVPPQFAWNKMMGGTYNQLRLAFIGTDGSQITIEDPQITITLVIRDKKDISIGDALSTATGGK